MMISSAVLIPEEPQLDPPEQNGSLKRRQSSVSESSESNKRPRLHSQTSPTASNNGAASPTAPAATSPTTTTAAGGHPSVMSPPLRRRQTSSTLEQDKSRNRRLFGALLGTLSQSSNAPRRSSAGTKVNNQTTTLNARREEIESRQRERLKRESHEIAESARLKREQLERERRVEQVRWDEEAMRLRHRNMRAAAGFLQTKAEPRLYYKPWELRDFEEDEIKRQMEDAEARIQREAEEFEEKKKLREEELKRGEEREKDAQQPSAPMTNPPGAITTDEMDDRHKTQDEANKDARGGELSEQTNDERNGEDHVSPLNSSGPVKDSDPAANATKTERGRSSSLKDQDDHDHGGEELERGQEDDVIY